MAHGRTLFLDETGEISATTQVMLLRVLEDHRFERVGGERTIEADVRIIAATNKDLERGLDSGRFRDDLYYRLNIISIHSSPLKEVEGRYPFALPSLSQEIQFERG